MTCVVKPGAAVTIEHTPALEPVRFAQDELVRYLGRILGEACRTRWPGSSPARGRACGASESAAPQCR